MHYPNLPSSPAFPQTLGVVSVAPPIVPDQVRIVAAAAPDYFTQYGWLPWVVVALIGASAGTTEIIAKYRDEPSRALTTKPAILYIAINAAASLIALVLIRQLGWTFSVGESQTDLLGLSQLLVAGFGAMVVLRTAVFTVRAPGKEEMIGPVNVLQTILNACDRAVDRKRASARAESVTRLMKDISFDRASVELPLVAIALLQNLSEEDKTRLADGISDLNRKRSSVSNEGLCLSLGLILLGVLGEDALQSAVTTVRARIEVGDDFTPVIDFMHPTVVTEAALNAGTDIPLSLSGRNFDSESKVLLDGQVQSTSFDSISYQLHAALPVSLLQGRGEHEVTVFTRSNNGGESAAALLLLEGAAPSPELESIDPQTIPAETIDAGAGLALTATGRDFVGASTLKIDGAAQPTTFVSEDQLTSQVPAAVLTVGEHQVTVFSNDSFGGKESSPLPLSVVPPGDANADAPAALNPEEVNVIVLGNPAPIV